MLQFMHERKASYEADRNRNSASANETERSLCGQLMLVSTVLLTGFVIFFGSRENTTKFTPHQIKLLISGIALLCFSIAAGVKYYFVLNKFFRSWATTDHKTAELYNDDSIKTWEEIQNRTDELQSKNKPESSFTWLFIQIALLASAAIAYVMLLIVLLIDVPIIK